MYLMPKIYSKYDLEKRINLPFVIPVVDRTDPVRMTKRSANTLPNAQGACKGERLKKRTYPERESIFGGHAPQMKTLKKSQLGFTSLMSASLCSRSIFLISFSRAIALNAYECHS